MNEALKVIMTRRSVRKYSDRPVTCEELDVLLRAAMQAPSARNRRPWAFVVILSKEGLRELAEVMPYGKMLVSAGACIAVCGVLEDDNAQSVGFCTEDCSAAMQNLLLAAHSTGLGAVWLGVHPIKQREEDVSKILKLPGNVYPMGLVSIGHPAEAPEPEDRFDKTRIHYEKW